MRRDCPTFHQVYELKSGVWGLWPRWPSWCPLVKMSSGAVKCHLRANAHMFIQGFEGAWRGFDGRRSWNGQVWREMSRVKGFADRNPAGRNYSSEVPWGSFFVWGSKTALYLSPHLA